MGNLDRSRLAKELEPYIASQIRSALNAALGKAALPTLGGSGGVIGITPPAVLTSHVLATATGLGTYHSISGATAGHVLRASGATTALFAQLQHGDLGGVSANQHHNQSHAHNSADHTGLLAWATVDKTGSNLGHLETRNYAQLNSRTHDIVGGDHSYTGGAALDVFGLSAASTLARLTPSADVSAGVAALLRSDATGAVIVNSLTAGGTTPYVRTPRLTSTSDLLVDPMGDITLSPGGNEVKIAGSTSFVSTNYLTGFPLAGFRLGPTLLAGQTGLRIGIIEADELRVRIFVADETRVDRGQLYLTKSYGLLSEPFTCPATVGASADIYFENSPNLGVDGALFTAGDWILLRYLDIDTGIDLLNCWGQVSGTPAFSNNAETGIRQQRWTFTFRAGTGGLLFVRGSMGIDFGASGQGYILMDAVSSDSPAITIGRWVTNPYTPANRTVLTAVGALGGVGYSGEYGLAASVDGFGDSDSWVKVSTAGSRLNNLAMEWWASGAKFAWANATSGFGVLVGAAYEDKRSFSFNNASGFFGGLQARYVAGVQGVGVVNYAVGASALTSVGAQADTGSATVNLAAVRGLQQSGIAVVADATGGSLNFYLPGSQWLHLDSVAHTADLHGLNLVVDGTVAASGGISGATGTFGGNVAVAGALDVDGQISTFSSFKSNGTLLDIYHGANRVYRNHPSGDSTFVVGAGRTADGSSYVDLYAAPGSVDFRIIRNTGVNGVADILQYGTGALRLTQVGGGDVEVWLDAAARFRFSGTDFSVLSAGGTATAPLVNATTTFQRDGVDGGIFVPVSAFYMQDNNAVTWNGAAGRNIGTYVFNPQAAANNSLPAEATAIVVAAGGKWTGSASDGKYILGRGVGMTGGQSPLTVRHQVANVTTDAFAVIPVGTNGDFQMDVVGENAAIVYVRCIGYFM